MYYSFLESANMANTADLRTWICAYWLNRAQQQLYNNLFFPEWDKQGEGPPTVAYQKDFKYTEDMAPFLVTLPNGSPLVYPATNNKGFWPFPDNLVRLTSLNVVTDGCDGAPEMVEVEEMRDMAIGATINNRYTRPKWTGTGWFRPKFAVENVNPGTNAQTRGVRLFPRGYVYQLYVRYLRMPTPIEVENTAEETALFSTASGYVTTAADVDSEFPPDRHQMLVDLAVALYFKASPDYQGFAQETAATNAGVQ